MPDRGEVTRAIVGRIARHIGDPLTRLRFLQYAAPLTGRDRRWRPKQIVWLTLAVVVTLGAAMSCALMLRASGRGAQPALAKGGAAALAVAPAEAGRPAPVWQVESDAESEVYSNGLRIDRHFATGTHARSYLAFPVNGGRAAVRRTEPAGIVFHSTESQQAPFEAGQNGHLRQIGESLLEYVRTEHAYNFLIDRFGRVHRVVEEGDVAYHAGFSVWADTEWLYVNLNDSFLGVSLEARSPASVDEPAISTAQIRAVAMLTEWLRSRYGIATANCVTHAQVSVNPDNMQAGYHKDWAVGFPFAEVGLPDNYRLPLAALWAFGFEYDGFSYDPSLPEQAPGGVSAGVELAQVLVRDQAAARGMKVADYRKTLERKYRDRLAEVRGPAPSEPRP